jgi:hypothetical protein
MSLFRTPASIPNRFRAGFRGGWAKFRLTKTKLGFASVEVLVAMGLVMLIAVSTTQALLVTNTLAARNRVMTAARAVVQRNIDAALSVPWDSDNPEPAKLAVTADTGQVDDDDGSSDNAVNLITLRRNSGDLIILQGTLTRIVTKVTNPKGADIRKITYRVNYKFLRKDYAVEMTTFRTIDD